MIGVTQTGKSQDISQNLSSAFAGVLFRFKHQHTATFRQQEAITVAIKWPRSSCWLVISACKAPYIVKRRNYDWRDWGVSTSGDHHVSYSVTDQFSRKTNCVSAGGAACRHC